jgi:DNA-binding protein HU-beta
MNKSEFIDSVAEKAELSKAAAARVVDVIFDAAGGAISEAVHAAGSLSLPGFGKFTKKTRPARTGRNPRTGTTIQIPERTTVAFSAGKTLKERGGTGGAASASAGGGATAKKSAARSGGSAGGGGGTATKSTGATAKKSAGGSKGGGATAKKSAGK